PDRRQDALSPACPYRGAARAHRRISAGSHFGAHRQFLAWRGGVRLRPGRIGSQLLPRSDIRSAPPAKPAGIDENAEIVLAFDDNHLASRLFGLYDQHLALLERRLGVLASANGNHVVLKGKPEQSERARRILEDLYARLRRGEDVTPGDVEGAIAEVSEQGQLFDNRETPPRIAFEQIATRKRGPVRARNAAQDVYLRALRRYEL